MCWIETTAVVVGPVGASHEVVRQVVEKRVVARRIVTSQVGARRFEGRQVVASRVVARQVVVIQVVARPVVVIPVVVRQLVVRPGVVNEAWELLYKCLHTDLDTIARIFKKWEDEGELVRTLAPSGARASVNADDRGRNGTSC